MELRVDELAARVGVSVDTVRFYQARGLLPAPRREGRLAWYGPDHLERLERIRALQGRGFSLATISRVLRGELDEADQALVGALHGPPSETLASLEELARRTDVPVPLLEAVVRQGLLAPRRRGDEEGFTEADAAAARAGLTLLRWGLPLPALIDLAAEHHRAVEQLAARAVALFDDHVRTRLRRDPRVGDTELGEELAAAIEEILPAAATLISHHATRVLLAAAMARVEQLADTPGPDRARDVAPVAPTEPSR